MAVDDAKDIYIQCALLLHTPGYLAFSRECVLEKLLPELALYVWVSENSAYSLHLFTDIVIHAPPSKQTEIFDKGVASIHHTTEELSLARSCASNQKSPCKLLCLPRVDTPRSPLSTGCNIFGRKLTLNHPQHMASTDGPTFSSIVQQLQDLRGSWACSLGGATLGFGNPLVWFEFLRREWGYW